MKARSRQWHGMLVLVAAVIGLAGCIYAPPPPAYSYSYPYYGYGPGYYYPTPAYGYYGPPVYGSVGFFFGRHFR